MYTAKYALKLVIIKIFTKLVEKVLILQLFPNTSTKPNAALLTMSFYRSYREKVMKIFQQTDLCFFGVRGFVTVLSKCTLL